LRGADRNRLGLDGKKEVIPPLRGADRNRLGLDGKKEVIPPVWGDKNRETNKKSKGKIKCIKYQTTV